MYGKGDAFTFFLLHLKHACIDSAEGEQCEWMSIRKGSSAAVRGKVDFNPSS